jgi:hypothetical protein
LDLAAGYHCCLGHQPTVPPEYPAVGALAPVTKF